jgi:phenylalanyl-tRNA synthetase beta chain
MKVTRNWLKEYVDFDWSTEELAERLTMLGLEVEGVVKTGGDFEGIVVAQVLTRDKHPNADKLSVCRVNDGKGERQIVCGAQNFQAGDKVPLILPGATLPPKPGEKEPFTIKVGKIRGVESQGMMCSADELGLDPDGIGLKKEDGLLILPASAEVGRPFSAFLGRSGSDVVYDLEVTPNRPDLNSVLGIAREIAAVTGNPLRLPLIDDLDARTGGAPATEQVSVHLEAADVCPRYTARVIRGVKVGPSPEWLKAALEKVGLRSISNVVDVTNYVMLETGQPLHAFDYHLLARGTDGRPTVVVRRAADGEAFVTLDGRTHALNPEHLLIADPQKGIALAGVMGGQNTEINDSTVDVLLESAWFAPTNIRRTSKSLGLRTDSSYRFERGADIGAAEWASRRAAQLILRTAGGTLAPGVVDAYPTPHVAKRIPLRHRKVNELLGLALSSAEIESFLASLAIQAVPAETAPGDAASTFEVPSFRVDLKRETDLVEEVARLYGVDRIPSTEPRLARGAHAFDARHDELMDVRRLLAGLGLDEAQGQTLVSRSSIPNGGDPEVVALSNPLSSDMDVLRPSLLPGLLDILGHNARHKNRDVALFEVGRVFRRVGSELKEGWRLALALTGARNPGFWSGGERDAAVDVFDLKGIVEALFEQLGLRGVTFVRRPEPVGLWVESAQVTLGGKLPLGELGQLHPRQAKSRDLRQGAVLAEFDLDQILARRNAVRSFKSLPAFPAIQRDVALQVAESVTHDAVLQAVRQAKAPNLESTQLFDVFRGAGLPAGQKSVAYRFTYRASDKTLTDAEVTAAHDRVLAQLRQNLGAELR